MAYQPKSYRKFIATAATATLVASAVAPAYAGSFSDVSDKYKEAVDFVVSKGVSGFGDGTFGVGKNITRVDAAVMLVKVLGLDADKAPASGFSDVPDRAAKYVNALKAAGITAGKGGKFDSYSNITRGELAVWIQKGFELKAAANTELKFTDVSPAYAEAIKALVENGVTFGKTDTRFGVADSAIRGDFALFLHRAHEAVQTVTPELSSVSAVADNKVVVSFNTAIKSVDHTNFAINGGKTVTKAELSADNKTVTLTLNSSLVDGYEYTVTASNIVSTKEVAAPAALTKSFKYEIAKVGKPTLSSRSFEPGQNVKNYVVVKDEAGKVISADLYEITGLDASVAGVIDTDGTVLNVETSANLRVTITMYTGEVITGDYETITVTPVATNTGMVKAAFTEKDNAVHAQRTSVKTSIEVGSANATELYVYSKDAKGNPEDNYLDLSKYTVKNLTPTIFSIDGSTVEGLRVGEGKLEITNSAGFKEVVSFKVVKSDNSYDDLTVAPTSGQLVSNSVNGVDFEEDIDQKTLSISWKDKDGNVNPVDFTGASTELPPTAKAALTVTGVAATGDKLVVSTQSEAVDFVVDENGKVAVQTKDLLAAQNVKVTVSYFKAGATSPTTTRTANLSVVQTNDVHAKYVVEQVGSLDAEYEVTRTVGFKVYSLDSKGVKIDDVTAETTFDFVGTLPAKVDHWIGEIDGSSVGFDTASNAENLLNYAGSFKLDYTVENIADATVGTDGEFTVDFTNSKNIQKSAKVSTSPIALDLNGGEINVGELVFGKANATELAIDAETDDVFAVLSGQDGYTYNKPIVSVLSKSGATMVQGVNVYGPLATSVIEYAFGDTQGIDFEYRVVNASNLVEGTEGTFSVGDAGSKATFELVIEGMYMADETRTGSLLGEANLIAEPVVVSVTLTK